MKKFILLSFFVSMAFATINAQTTTPKEQPADGPKITFSEQEHNYPFVILQQQLHGRPL